MANHNVKSWATVRETSVEIAEAIFELAGNDEVLAQKIWEEGSDEALEKAFAKPPPISFIGERKPSSGKTFERLRNKSPGF